MLFGMWGLIASVVLASTSQSIVVLAVAMFGLGLFKLLFDGCTTAWVNDHVPYERRGRVIGIIETSWALGLLIGVLLMGVVTGLTSWRYGFGFGGAASAVSAWFVLRSLPNEPAVIHELHPEAKGRVHGHGWLVVAAMFLLMVAAQAVGVTFGPWLSDSFDASDFVIAVVAFAMGGCELLASITVTRRADVWGKERSVVIGALLMVPSGLLLALGHHNEISGLVALMVFFGFFEYTVVTMFPIAAHLVPGRTGAGLGVVIGAGTFGRAVATPISTMLYDNDSLGFAGPALVGACAALLAGVLMRRYKTRTIGID
jgi:predicted MFS family arabinose efflux permease